MSNALSYEGLSHRVLYTRHLLGMHLKINMVFSALIWDALEIWGLRVGFLLRVDESLRWPSGSELTHIHNLLDPILYAS